uniref:Poly [ADP-ribose] polymerase n=1 Tax=Scleropages formosus TaxID=113540 RepID=A0A8C9UY58_SCLFO
LQRQKDGHDVLFLCQGFFGQISTPDKGVYRMQISHLTLEVSSGDITKQDTDVIVNSSSPDFTLKTGVSKAILEGAGKAVESQCKDLGSKPNEGIIMTSPGNLPCKNIIHVYIKNNTADIMDKILSVLLMCEEKKFKSVSFPALGTGVNIPSHWDPMNNSETKQIELKTDSNEFQEVKDLFRATSSDFTVKKIERIQNSSLWQNYQIKKRQTDEKNSHSNNERRLFHGTSVDTIQKINAHGFNRSFHGKNADVYGNGTYFAVDAKYSAQGTYSSMDDKGQKYMYLARVIVGNYTRGQKGLREPPPKDPTNPTDLYDSVVDKKDNPSMFVVFHDVQAYPEYLITFCQS